MSEQLPKVTSEMLAEIAEVARLALSHPDEMADAAQAMGLEPRAYIAVMCGRLQALMTPAVVLALARAASAEVEATRLRELVATEHQAYLRADERAAESEENAERYAVLRDNLSCHSPADHFLDEPVPPWELDALADALRAARPATGPEETP